jgi:acyl-CoA synthetase (NDP forming)
VSWKNEALSKLFNPARIAVIGASDRPDRLGALSLLALEGFSGQVFPVNPNHKTINEKQCFPSVDKISKPVDLALICLPEPAVAMAIQECAAAGVKSAIIFTAGFKELGPEGEDEQQRIKELVNAAHIAVIGPNCLGAGNINIDMNATFFPHPQPLGKGNVAIISQSGGVCGLMLYSAVESDIGVSKFASVGNRVNIEFHDLLRYLVADDDTSVICMFVEGTESGREMYDAMTEVATKKPIIVVKVGKTPIARQAALSHTGSLAGNHEIYSAAIKQSKAIEAASIQEMMDTAKVLSMCRNFGKGRSVGIVTHTLGVALIAAQTLEERGVALPLPTERTKSIVQNILNMPVDVPIRNPIDLLAQGWADPSIFSRAFELAAHEDQYDAIMTVFAPNYLEGIGGGMPVEDIISVTKEVNKAVVSVLSSPITRKPPGALELHNAGIPVFTSPHRAAAALAHALQVAKSRQA